MTNTHAARPAFQFKSLPTIDDADVQGKKVLVRVDLNVPMKHNKVADITRITRLLPTLETLIKRKAKVILLSHFGRPKGTFVREMSLAPLVDALSEALGGREVKFSVDCIGKAAEDAVATLEPGEVLLLENVRFHPGETTNAPEFVAQLAKLGDAYVNDTFSCSHRAHASVVGIAEKLPAYAGYLLKEELDSLQRVLANPAHPIAAIVGGSKISTKLGVLEQLATKVDFLIIGGAMANTFLIGNGIEIGTSLIEKDHIKQAQNNVKIAVAHHCNLILPVDAVTAVSLEGEESIHVVPVTAVPPQEMILDIGPESITRIIEILASCKTVVWNGPLGAFEYSPFEQGTAIVARQVAKQTSQGHMVSIGGGGDIVAALTKARVSGQFTYISTAGGAFLEWLEGKPLPGIAVISA